MRRRRRAENEERGDRRGEGEVRRRKKSDEHGEGWRGL